MTPLPPALEEIAREMDTTCPTCSGSVAFRCYEPLHAKIREGLRKAAEWKEKEVEAWISGKEPQR